MFQSLIRTCSHAPLVETENEGEAAVEDFNVKVISYKDYMQIWSGLLDAAQLKVCLFLQNSLFSLITIPRLFLRR